MLRRIRGTTRVAHGDVQSLFAFPHVSSTYVFLFLIGLLEFWRTWEVEIKNSLGGSSPSAGGCALCLTAGALLRSPTRPACAPSAECAHTEADYDEETARENYVNPPAGHRSGPGGPADA